MEKGGGGRGKGRGKGKSEKRRGKWNGKRGLLGDFKLTKEAYKVRCRGKYLALSRCL